ncbi:hypothetical protein BIGA_1779 [Bifidobacterium pullorum subsp. gallinarum]|uniref:Uncharacterized protein n=1 Tax=Bifidobacterium pullorum subsp. gallinarum TaxID=78344 RepID=A0A087AL51_9BIFI|nr:hypothetical protein BIGA_1779 [Bifidobacterium pullorum subsp. gallinarum]
MIVRIGAEPKGSSTLGNQQDVTYPFGRNKRDLTNRHSSEPPCAFQAIILAASMTAA